MEPHRGRPALACNPILLALLPCLVWGQEPDSAHVFQLQTITVTAERVPSPLRSSVLPVSLINRDEIQKIPTRSFSDLLSSLPGVLSLPTDGSGYIPSIVSRGFYGGGEADYVLFVVDGIPLRAAESGLIPWTLLPLRSIKTVDMARGGNAALYGDAAVAGVIAMQTTPPGTNRGEGLLFGGSFHDVEGTLSGSGSLWSLPVALDLSHERNAGFRDHSKRSSTHVSGSIAGKFSPELPLTFRTMNSWSSSQDLGPFPEVSGTRIASLPFFRFDEKTERLHRISVDTSYRPSASLSLMATMWDEIRKSEGPRTLLLSSTFADTRYRTIKGGKERPDPPGKLGSSWCAR